MNTKIQYKVNDITIPIVNPITAQITKADAGSAF
jgi:hypothetical protein